jgi:hypothetical protein
MHPLLCSIFEKTEEKVVHLATKEDGVLLTKDATQTEAVEPHILGGCGAPPGEEGSA